eukprot:1656162-Pyramimonas_sp.AAC.1
MAIPPPMYSRSAIESRQPSPSSDPLSSLWRVQMEHFSLLRGLITAGLTLLQDSHGGLQRELALQHSSPGGWAIVIGCNLVVVGIRGERADALDSVLQLP